MGGFCIISDREHILNKDLEVTILDSLTWLVKGGFIRNVQDVHMVNEHMLEQDNK